MTTPINDGGPAFPLQEHGDSRSVPGMSLRDYFAGQALTGILAHPQCRSVNEIFRAAAKESFKIADAMLEARNQSKP